MQSECDTRAIRVRNARALYLASDGYCTLYPFTGVPLPDDYNNGPAVATVSGPASNGVAKTPHSPSEGAVLYMHMYVRTSYTCTCSTCIHVHLITYSSLFYPTKFCFVFSC